MKKEIRAVAYHTVILKYRWVYISHKKEWNWVICRDVDGPRDCHTKWSKSEREKQILYINAYMWSLEKWYRWTCLQGRNRDTDVENKRMETKGGNRGGKDCEYGINRDKLLYIGWINNKVLLYSTGNYIQYPVANHNGKIYEKKNIYITELLFCPEEINITL